MIFIEIEYISIKIIEIKLFSIMFDCQVGLIDKVDVGLYENFLWRNRRLTVPIQALPAAGCCREDPARGTHMGTSSL